MTVLLEYMQKWIFQLFGYVYKFVINDVPGSSGVFQWKWGVEVFLFLIDKKWSTSFVNSLGPGMDAHTCMHIFTSGKLISETDHAAQIMVQDVLPLKNQALCKLKNY